MFVRSFQNEYPKFKGMVHPKKKILSSFLCNLITVCCPKSVCFFFSVEEILKNFGKQTPDWFVDWNH